MLHYANFWTCILFFMLGDDLLLALLFCLPYLSFPECLFSIFLLLELFPHLCTWHGFGSPDAFADLQGRQPHCSLILELVDSGGWSLQGSQELPVGKALTAIGSALGRAADDNIGKTKSHGQPKIPLKTPCT